MIHIKRGVGTMCGREGQSVSGVFRNKATCRDCHDRLNAAIDALPSWPSWETTKKGRLR